MRISAGLKGFSGKNCVTRARKHISVLSEPQPKVHVYELLCLEGTTERSDGNTKFADESERSELSEQTGDEVLG